MPVLATKRPPEIVLSGTEFEPEDLAWVAAPEPERTAYWREVGRLAFERKIAELNRGIGPDGRKLPPRRRVRRDRAGGPVLVPHWSDSRFVTELRYEPRFAVSAVLYWTPRWSRIVGYHAVALGPRSLPVRDVVGLTQKSQAQIAAAARKWWAGRVARRPLGGAALPTITLGGGVRERVVASVSGFTRLRGLLGEGPTGPQPPGPPTPPLPALQAPPAITRQSRPWDVHQAVRTVLDAAGEGRVSRAVIRATLLELDRTQTTADLLEVAVRLGISPAPTTRGEALQLIERTLLERLRSAEAVRQVIERQAG